MQKDVAMLHYTMQFVLINLQTTEVNIVSHLQLQKKLMVLKRRCWHFALLWQKRFNKCIIWNIARGWYVGYKNLVGNKVDKKCEKFLAWIVDTSCIVIRRRDFKLITKSLEFLNYDEWFILEVLLYGYGFHFVTVHLLT